MGMTIEQIIDATQLSKEEIEKLSEKKIELYVYKFNRSEIKIFDWYFLCLCFFRYSVFLHIAM